MLKTLISLFLLAFLIIPYKILAVNNPPQLIPREVIFSNPDKSEVQLSHDGEHISYLATKNGVMNIFIAPLDRPNESLAVTDDKARGINEYSWAYDNKHIIFSNDSKGEGNTRYYSYNVFTKETKALTPEDNVTALLLKSSLAKPDEIVVATNERDPLYLDIYTISLISGEKKMIFANEKYHSFLIDNNLDIRFAAMMDAAGGIEYHEYKKGQFRPFITFPLEDTVNSYIHSIDTAMDHTGENLYIIDTRGRDKAALMKYNLITRKMSLMAESNKADLRIFTSDPIHHRVQGVIEEYEKESYQILDLSIKNDIDYLVSMKQGNINIISRSNDDKKWLVSFNDDVYLGKFYYYDREKQSASYLFNTKKSLDNYTTARKHPVIIKSRDNINLVSYITFPKTENIDESFKTSKTLPLVLNVHGGPWDRDSLSLDVIHQWLSDRGYVVLSVNYRGSTGFGKKFLEAGNLEWGKKMQEDLIDAVNWAINKRIADPAKIGIFGISYGGYATLCGLTMTPDVFACGVDCVGPSNLITYINSFGSHLEPVKNYWKKKLGGWETEEEQAQMQGISPLFKIDNITKPLLIAHGENDLSVSRAESDQVFDVMTKNGLPITYLRYPDEGHYFQKATNRRSFFAIVEDFLAKHLGGDLEPLQGEDFRNSSVIINHVIVNDSKDNSLMEQLLKN